MTVESANYIADLDATIPPGTNQKKEGDNHLRLIKSVLQNSFTGFGGCILLTGSDAGSANNYAINPTPALTAYNSGLMVILTPSANNTTASTLNISSLGAKTIKNTDGTDVAADDLAAGSSYLLFYDGTNFLIGTGPTKNYIDTNAGLSAATQAQMEAATDNTVGATPANTQYHPGVAKAWLVVDGTFTASILASHNITSITDNGTGDITVTIATDFSSVYYTINVDVAVSLTSEHAIVSGFPNAGDFKVRDYWDNSGTWELTDPNQWYITCFGDQA